MKKVILVAAPLLILGAAGAAADTLASKAQFQAVSPTLLLAERDPWVYTNKDGMRSANDPTEDLLEQTDPDEDPQGFKDKESVTFDIDEKAGPDYPNAPDERLSAAQANTSASPASTYQREDHVGIKSGPTNPAGVSVPEQQKDITPGAARRSPSERGSPMATERTFKAQESTGVRDPSIRR